MLDSKNEQLEKNKGVGGWLLLLCFILIIASPAGALYKMYNLYNHSADYPFMEMLLNFEGVVGIVVAIIGVYAGLALWNNEQGAVRLAKNYFLIFLGSLILIVVFAQFVISTTNHYVEDSDEMMWSFILERIPSLFYFAVWYWYLNVSKRVKATYNLDLISNEIENLNATWECPKCKAENQNNTYQCSSCGYSLI